MVSTGVKDSSQTPQSPSCLHIANTSTVRRCHFDRREFSQGLELSQRSSCKHPYLAYSGPQKRMEDGGRNAPLEERERTHFPTHHLNSHGPPLLTDADTRVWVGSEFFRGLSGERSLLSRVRCLQHRLAT